MFSHKHNKGHLCTVDTKCSPQYVSIARDYGNVTKLIVYFKQILFYNIFGWESFPENVMMMLTNSLYSSASIYSTQFNQLQTSKEMMCLTAPGSNAYTASNFPLLISQSWKESQNKLLETFSKPILGTKIVCRLQNVEEILVQQIGQLMLGNLELDRDHIVYKLGIKIFSNDLHEV